MMFQISFNHYTHEKFYGFLNDLKTNKKMECLEV
jgi:hypothetical protein